MHGIGPTAMPQIPHVLFLKHVPTVLFPSVIYFTSCLPFSYWSNLSLISLLSTNHLFLTFSFPFIFLLLLLLFFFYFGVKLELIGAERLSSTMIKTLSPYSTATTAKTAEIMSRYRPIAPKPEPPASAFGESQKISQSPYLRSLWPQLQARPTRTRKRGRTAISPPSIRRPRTATTTHVLGVSSSSHMISSARHVPFQGFVHEISQLHDLAEVNSLENPVSASSDLVTLSLLPCQPSVLAVAVTPETTCMDEKVIDLNTAAEIPEEKDLLQQLQAPPRGSINVIAPQPIRPVGSSISVGFITEDLNATPPLRVPKKPHQVEHEIESEALPAVISDSNYKVRLANAAYKELVGQPECSWLDSMITGNGRFGGGSCKRICGEVTMNIDESRVPVSTDGFSCWVRIEWGHEGNKKAINSFCDVIRLSCESKDYLFMWKFHTHNANREGSQSTTSSSA